MIKFLACVLAFCPLATRAAGELVLAFAPDMAAPPVALAATGDGGFLASVRGRIDKYEADGARASGFNSALDVNSLLWPSLIVPDGRGNWFVGGWAVLDGKLFSLVKLQANGALASDFSPVATTRASQSASPSVLAIGPDGLGGCFVGGTFTELNFVAALGLAHIDASGKVTARPRPASLSVETPTCVAAVPRGVLVVQERDAFILAANGDATTLEQPAMGRWSRINSATYDPRFGIALAAAHLVNGFLEDRIFVWDANGRLDPTFKQAVIFGQPPMPLLWDSAGRLLGINTRVASESGGVTDDGSLRGAKRILRDGSLDPTWSRTLTFEFAQGALCELANGDVLVAGAFTKVAGHDRRNVVRLTGANDSGSSFVQQSSRGWVEGDRKRMIIGLYIPDRGRTVDVLIRAMSGSLQKLGVAETAPSTQFFVYRGPTLVAMVLGGSPDAIARFVGARTGAFPADFAQEAQAVISLQPGAHTVVISSRFGGVGEVLGEIYFPN